LHYSTVNRTIIIMTNVSKRKLPEKEFVKLRSQFEKAISKLDAKTAGPFVRELLGPEEYLMLAKRLCAVVMYVEGNSSYRVWQLLNMSPSTAEKIRLDYYNGRYKHVTAALMKHRKDYEEFWSVLEVVLRAGMPPRGRGRWKSVFQASRVTK
jgi:hypothetical protein